MDQKILHQTCIYTLRFRNENINPQWQGLNQQNAKILTKITPTIIRRELKEIIAMHAS